MIKKVMLSLLAAVVLFGCYYDNEQELYPVNAQCDTTNITYSQFVKPMMDQQCVSCHSATNPQGQVNLSDYTNVKVRVTDGKLYGSLAHSSGYVAMPQGGTAWSACNLSKLKAWINKGAPNN